MIGPEARPLTSPDARSPSLNHIWTCVIWWEQRKKDCDVSYICPALKNPLPPKSYDLCKHFYQKFQPLSPYSSHLCKHFYQTFQQMCAPIVPFLPDV